MARQKGNNIYEKNLALIAEHYRNDRFDQARALVDEELGMPYTPAEYLPRFKQWKNQLEADQRIRQSVKTRTKDELLELLRSSRREEQLEAITALHSYVLKPEDLPLLAAFLANEQAPRVFRALLAQVLVDQKIDRSFAYDQAGKELFNPVFLAPLRSAPSFVQTVRLLDGLFAKEPSAMEFAAQYCVFYFMFVFPALPDLAPAELADRIFAYTKCALSNEPPAEEPVAEAISAAIRQNSGIGS